MAALLKPGCFSFLLPPGVVGHGVGFIQVQCLLENIDICLFLTFQFLYLPDRVDFGIVFILTGQFFIDSEPSPGYVLY
jgi:hypothetical protein